jgi:vitamin B12 transporter
MNRTIAVLCPLLASGIAASAAESQAPVHRDTLRVPAVSVTATKTGSPVSGHLVTTTVVRGAELKSRGLSTVAQAVREVAGVTVIQSGGSGAQTAAFVRGGQSNYVKVLVDGVPINEAGGYVDWANLTLDNVDRIEVVRGPASVLHGSDAVSGVVQIFTRVREPRRALRAATRFSSQDRQLGRFDAAPLDDRRSYGREFMAEGATGTPRLALTGSLANRADDGSLRFNNEYRNSTASLGMHARVDSTAIVRMSTRYTDARFNYPTDFAGSATDSNAFRDETRTIVSAQLERRIDPRTELVLLAGLHRMRDLSSDLADSPGDSLGFYSEVNGNRERQTVEGRLNIMTTPLAVTTIGMEVVRQHERSEGWSRFASFSPDSTRFDERRRNTAFFAQVLGEAEGGVLYQLGGRHDRNEKFGSFNTWRGAVSLPVGPATRLKGAIGTSFREPAFHEVFATAFSRGNRDLSPERSLGWEAALEWSLRFMRLTVAYFDQSFRDMIQWNPGAVAGEADYANVARATSRGFEVELRAAERNRFQGWLGYTHAGTRVTDAGFHVGESATFVEGQSLLRRPITTVTGGGSWRSSRNSRFSVSANHVGKRPDRDFTSFPAEPVTLDAYTTVDISVELPFAASASTAPFTLLFRADNVTGAEIEPVFGYVAPRRVLSVGASVTMR